MVATIHRLHGNCPAEGLVQPPSGRIYIADGLSKLPDLVLPSSTKHLLSAWDPRRLNDAKGVRGKAVEKTLFRASAWVLKIQK